MNTLMLTLAVRLGGSRVNPVRVLLGAAAGAAIALAAGGLSRMQAMLVWLPAAMIMMRIARGKGTQRSLLADALLLLCAAGLLGGMVLCFAGATGSIAMAYVLGGIAAIAIGYCALRAKRAKRSAEHARVICTYRKKRAVFDAMIDSGNTLRDYLTHLPVIVIAEHTARKMLDLDDALLRPIFAQTAGGRQQMRVFTPQEIALEIDGVSQSVQAVIALSPGMGADVPALVPQMLLDGEWNIN
ncbi:MAG: sigma-E processing peptidase SpoIIGA [Clostridia bacterium]|nr:sigma-E processing peptidase SpoIIGA [Clostridia bacterium]